MGPSAGGPGPRGPGRWPGDGRPAWGPGPVRARCVPHAPCRLRSHPVGRTDGSRRPGHETRCPQEGALWPAAAVAPRRPRLGCRAPRGSRPHASVAREHGIRRHWLLGGHLSTPGADDGGGTGRPCFSTGNGRERTTGCNGERADPQSSQIRGTSGPLMSPPEPTNGRAAKQGHSAAEGGKRGTGTGTSGQAGAPRAPGAPAPELCGGGPPHPLTLTH